MKITFGLFSFLMISSAAFATTNFAKGSDLGPQQAADAVQETRSVFRAPNSGAPPAPPANSGAPSNSPGPIIPPPSSTSK